MALTGGHFLPSEGKKMPPCFSQLPYTLRPGEVRQLDGWQPLTNIQGAEAGLVPTAWTNAALRQSAACSPGPLDKVFQAAGTNEALGDFLRRQCRGNESCGCRCGGLLSYGARDCFALAALPALSRFPLALRRYCCKRVVRRPLVPCLSIKACQEMNSSTERL